MHKDIFSTEFLPFPNYSSHVVLCSDSKKVRMRWGRGGGGETFKQVFSISERRGCFSGKVRNFWLDQIFRDCCIWRKTDHSHQRFTISGYSAEFQYSIKYYSRMRHREEKTLCGAMQVFLAGEQAFRITHK